MAGGGLAAGGDNGDGDALADEGVFLCDELPPHSDMKERTARTDATISEGWP